MSPAPPTRRISFEYPADLDPVWNPNLPEFAIAANSISLLMPFVEPYVIKAVKVASSRLDGSLAIEADAFCRQEAQHHKQHQRFNQILAGHYRGVNRLERWMDRIFSWLWSTRSADFSLAFAAGAETIAYTLARWTESRMGRLFRGADSTMATLFLWHLAEEVEHKSVAFDVYRATVGRRGLAAGAMLSAAIVVGVFGIIGGMYFLAAERRLFKPITYWRMIGWTVTYIFDLLPAMAVAALAKKHHPSDLSDPQWFGVFLAGFDPETGKIPLVEI